MRGFRLQNRELESNTMLE